MPKTVPWHFVGEAIYHNHTACSAWQARGPERRDGSGGKRLCPDCQQLARGGPDGIDEGGQPGAPLGRSRA